MTSLTTAKRDQVAQLLEAHQRLTAAIKVVGKKGWFVGLNVSDSSSNDYEDASLDPEIARRALAEQKAAIDAQLKRLGIEIK